MSSLCLPLSSCAPLTSHTVWDGWGHPPTLIATRGVTEHAHRRKAWNRALSAVAVRDYEATVATRSRQLVERWKGLVEARQTLSSSKDEKSTRFKSALIDLSRWMGFFTYELRFSRLPSET